MLALPPLFTRALGVQCDLATGVVAGWLYPLPLQNAILAGCLSMQANVMKSELPYSKQHSSPLLPVPLIGNNTEGSVSSIKAWLSLVLSVGGIGMG